MASSNASPAPTLDTDTAYNAGFVSFATDVDRHFEDTYADGQIRSIGLVADRKVFRRAFVEAV